MGKCSHIWMVQEMSRNNEKQNLYNWKLIQNQKGQKYLEGTLENQKIENAQEIKTEKIFGVSVFDDFVHFISKDTVYECRYCDCKQTTETLKMYPQLLLRVNLELTKKKLKYNKELIAKQNEIFERVISSMIDKTREQILQNDDEYLSLEEKRARMEDSFLHIDQYAEAMKLVSEYIDIVQQVDMRFADVSYLAGVKDTISLMAGLGFFEKKV